MKRPQAIDSTRTVLSRAGAASRSASAAVGPLTGGSIGGGAPTSTSGNPAACIRRPSSLAMITGDGSRELRVRRTVLCLASVAIPVSGSRPISPPRSQIRKMPRAMPNAAPRPWSTPPMIPPGPIRRRAITPSELPRACEINTMAPSRHRTMSVRTHGSKSATAFAAYGATTIISATPPTKPSNARS